MKKQTNQKSKNLHRIKIIQGHVEAIKKMIEEDSYCVEVIHQSLAVQKALKRLDMELIKSHLNNCVIEQLKNDKKDKAIEELLQLYEMK